MEIIVSNKQKDLRISIRRTKTLIKAILQAEKVDCSEISVYFVSEKRITNLHAEFFDDPTPTDCVTFPLDNEILGEIFVCPKAAIDYCKKKGGDPLVETALYIVHGILHLLGYDDLDTKNRRAMRKKEKKCMAHLKELKIFL